jgi:bifunctional DNA-binding transcriptional regulator/antitoxin component of YhaV-PrlF toxin-antitoxin module
MEKGKQTYRARLRSKGRLTLPRPVRSLLQVAEGDDVTFSIDASGRIEVQHLPVIDPDQAWFWSERWQKMEQTAQADIDEGRLKRFKNVEDALGDL